MNYPEEAAGIALAAAEVGMPVVISFTVETDGRLASGHSVAEAIAIVDERSAGAPAYYMLNCSHPSHLPEDVAQVDRLRGFRANASRMSHAELDESDTLDAGDPHQLAAEFAELRQRMPSLTVLGGCCGTDARHVAAIARAVV
jgi:S-methylmethionine-dependent homocysteine/selenocysteine methylase